MNISAPTPTITTQPAIAKVPNAKPSGPNLPVATHEALGTLKFNWGLEECESWWSRDAIRAGAIVGAKSGYDTLKAAVADLAEVTYRNEAPAVLVLRDGDRFVARQLQAKTLTGYERDGGPKWHVVNEIPGNMDIMDVRRDAVDTRVAAIVDGRLVHTFRAR